MTLFLLFIAAVIIICILATRLSYKFGVPTLLIFILLGMIFGSDGIFKISFDDFVISENICTFALIYIMFYFNLWFCRIILLWNFKNQSA